MPKAKEKAFSVNAQGSKSEHGSGGAGRITMSKELAKNLELKAYLEGYLSKAKSGDSRGEVTGGGLSLTKRFKKGGPVKPGLYANIHAKRKRIAAGSKEKMRKPGTKGAPTAKAFVKSAKTAKRR